MVLSLYSYVDSSNGFLAKDTYSIFGEIVNIVAYKKGTYKEFEVVSIKVYYRIEHFYKNLCDCARIGVEAFKYYNEIYSAKH